MNDYQKPGAAKRQSAILLRTAQKFDLRGLWIFIGGRLIAFRSHSRRLDAFAHERTQARHAKILLCVNAFASKSGLNRVLC
jgi:hypothetical protein